MKPLALVGRKHKSLSSPASQINDVDDEIRTLAKRLHRTCVIKHGYSIAANQVGIPINMVVTHEGQTYINVNVSGSGATEEGKEACLSIPGRSFLVPRFIEVELSAFDLDGGYIFKKVKDFEARMWQHENDHLMGRLISDRWKEVRR